ncbi:MAG: protein-disulfide reductase DsbD domain-containing protein [Sulfitobacter sp.]
MIKSLISAFILGLAAAPLAAQNTIGTPVTGEILTGWQQADGTRVAAIKLTLAPGWKTYWRSPGDNGIPPAFDWSGSSNLRGVGMIWPAPKVFRQGGVRTIGYANELILPITIAPQKAGNPVTLRADLDIGVCSDICVPKQMTLTATLDTTSGKPTPTIAAALAARPYSASEAGVKSATCALRPNANGLEIETKVNVPSAGGREVVVIEPGQPNMWMSETDSSRSGGQLIATGDLASTSGGALAIDRSAIRITVLGSKHAVEILGCTPG